MELVQITAQYSNAVLVAVMPYVADFSQKLDLPVKTPIAISQVLEFKCDPRKGQIGGLITLTNGLRFAFLDGHVSSYRSPKSYFSLQDPDLIPKFFGSVGLKEKEALNIAKAAEEKLGFTNNIFHLDQKPKVTLPEKIGPNCVARYRFQWLDSNWHGSTDSGIIPAILDVEVDASSGQIQMLSMASPSLAAPAPKVDVFPPVITKPESNAKRQLSGGQKTESVNSLYAMAFLEAILPQLSNFVFRVGLPLHLPIRTNDIDFTQYHCRLLNGSPMAQIYLTNGDRFNYEHGRLVAFYAHNAYHKFPHDGRLLDFTGKASISTNEAIAICERAIKNLGYNIILPKAMLGNVTRIGAQDIKRHVYYWWGPDQMNFATIEIDMENQKITSFYLDDPSLWRDPPAISVPVFSQPTSK